MDLRDARPSAAAPRRASSSTARAAAAPAVGPPQEAPSHCSPNPHRTSYLALGALFTLALAAVSFGTGCSGVTRTLYKLDPSKIKLEDPRHQAVRGTRASLEIPHDLKREADRVWTLKQHKGLVFVLNVQRLRRPDEGMERWLKRRVELAQRTGRANLIRNEAVELGELDGRYIEAIDLLGDNRRVLYQVVVEAEDGLYVASLYAPLSLHKSHGAALKTTVRSLRIAAP